MVHTIYSRSPDTENVWHPIVTTTDNATTNLSTWHRKTPPPIEGVHCEAIVKSGRRKGRRCLSRGKKYKGKVSKYCMQHTTPKEIHAMADFLANGKSVASNTVTDNTVSGISVEDLKGLEDRIVYLERMMQRTLNNADDLRSYHFKESTKRYMP